MKRVSTRDFLRNINSMTEPVEVYTRSTLKGTWLPNTTWIDDISVARDTIRALYEGFNVVPSSAPVTVGADAGQAPSEAGGSLGAAPRRRSMPRHT